MKIFLNDKNGITLIALVITIIVMLILVAVTISMAVNGKLFDYAGKAATDTEKAKQTEQNLTNVESGLSTDELIDTFVDQSVTNPYKDETPEIAWTYKNNSWSDGVDEEGDIIARAYNKGQIVVDNENKTAYHLVVEYLKGDGVIKDMGDPHDGFGVWHYIPNGCLTKVFICDGIIEIGKNAFRACSQIIDVKISNTVKVIGYCAFMSCSSMPNIRIPSSVENIGQWAFSCCQGFTEITISNGVTSMEKEAFEQCYNLKKIKLSDSLTSLPKMAFADCSNLTDVIFPESFQSLSEQAFYRCTSLKNLKIPKGFHYFGYNVFSGCTNLTNIDYEGTINEFRTILNQSTSSWKSNSSLETITCTDGVITL